MKINHLFYIYPENKIYLSELDEQEQKTIALEHREGILIQNF
jgi:hypothetical protein